MTNVTIPQAEQEEKVKKTLTLSVYKCKICDTVFGCNTKPSVECPFCDTSKGVIKLKDNWREFNTLSELAKAMENNNEQQ